MNEKKTDLILGIISGVIGIVTFVLTLSFPNYSRGSNVPGPAFFPRILGILFLIIAVIQICKSCVKKDYETKEIIEIDYKKMAILIGLFIFYIGLLNLLGFFITTIAFLLVLQKVLGVKLKTNIIVTVIIVLLIFLIFNKLFAVSLPSGILF